MDVDAIYHVDRLLFYPASTRERGAFLFDENTTRISVLFKII